MHFFVVVVFPGLDAMPWKSEREEEDAILAMKLLEREMSF